MKFQKLKLRKKLFSKSLNLGLGLFCILLFAQSDFLYGQDPEFSQFYANPLYLNPALAGTGECSRANFNYRNQWPSMPGNFITYNASIDHYVNFLSGGVGLLINTDNAGDVISTTQISGIYAYHLNLNETTILNAGFEATLHQQKIKNDGLIYPDMIDPITGNVNQGLTGENLPNKNIMIPDFSIGFALGIKDKYYIGIAGHHLMQPNVSFYGQENSFLYRKFTVHAGGRFNIGSSYDRKGKSRFAISPNVLFRLQNNTQQLNAGIYVELSPIIIGTWYRHNITNSDGAIFLVGMKHNNFRIGYSYDLSLSKLKSANGGAHEVSFILLFNCQKKRNRPGAIKCPEF